MEKVNSLKCSSEMKRKRKIEQCSSDSEMKGRTSKRYKKKLHKRKSKSKLKKKKESRYSDSSNSDSDTSAASTSSEERKRKKRKKEKRKNKLKYHVSQKDAAESGSDDIVIGPLPPADKMINRIVREEVSGDVIVGPLPPSDAIGNEKSMAPMTKDEWEKRQSVVKRVFDEDTGRWRLVKGDGEILEEIVSRDRHKEINRLATAGDGLYFQSKITDKMKHK